jgi:hypothetical protein
LHLPDRAHDLGGAEAIGGGENDIGAPDMLLRRAPIRNDCFEPTTIVARNVDRNSSSHLESLLLRAFWESSECGRPLENSSSGKAYHSFGRHLAARSH